MWSNYYLGIGAWLRYGRIWHGRVNRQLQPHLKPSDFEVLEVGYSIRSCDQENIFPCSKQQQNVLNSDGKKPPAPRKEKGERKRDRAEKRPDDGSHDSSDSKENQEAQQDPLADLPKDGDSDTAQDSKNADLKKRGGESDLPLSEAC